MIERHAVIGVLGCSGGIGASTYAAVLACVAGASLVVDVDASGGGIDVLLGIEDASGARWSGVRVGGGRIDPQVLCASVPSWGPCGVLAADVSEVSPEALGEVIDAARQVGPVILDLARHESAARSVGLSRCNLVVLLVRSDVAGLAAAHAVAQATGDRTRLGLIARRGSVPCAEAARVLALPLLGVLPALRQPAWRPDWRRLPAPSRRVAQGIVDGLRVEAAAA